MKLILSALLCALVLAYGPGPAPGSPVANGYRFTVESGRLLKEESLTSGLMGRAMPYRVLLPVGYESADKKKSSYPVLYLLHGLTGNYKDWSEKTKIADYTVGADLIIVMPDGANGWYTDSITNPNEKYEGYIVKELIPDIEKKFRAVKKRESRMIAGLSMGGYGALKFGVKYPEMFALAGSFSGALRAPEYDSAKLTGFPAAADSINAVFGPMESEVRKENDIYTTVKNLNNAAKMKMPFFYIDCGTEDFLLAQNQDFARLLHEKSLPHEFRQLPGGHDWRFWNTQIEQFLILSRRFVDVKPAGAE